MSRFAAALLLVTGVLLASILSGCASDGEYSRAAPRGRTTHQH
jgi:hypothetical protein